MQRKNGGFETVRNKLIRNLRLYGGLYLLILPVLIYVFVFSYIPMYGVTIAFKDYKFIKGIAGSPWANNHGLKYFIRFLSSSQFPRVMSNTVIISAMRLLISFPAPVILAILLNELRSQRFKRVVQSITYLPHFMSWVVISALLLDILNPVNGIVNAVIVALGGKAISFSIEPSYFRWLLVLASMWKEVGWGSVVYLAAITGLDLAMYEAADIDGANRFQRIIYITLPSIMPVVTIMFILRIGNFLNAGFDEIINMYNPAVYSVSDIIDTYAYRVGLVDMNFSYSAAIGLFKNVIGAMMLVITNIITRSTTGEGVW